MGDVFYIVGIALTLSALVISFLGLRAERFPGSRGLLAGALGVMGALVVTTCAFAVVLAREEAEHREEERAHAEQEAAAEEPAEQAPPGTPEQEQAPGDGPTQETEPASGTIVEVSSPEAGDLLFKPDQLEAEAGVVEIEYTNPSPVPHNVAIEVDGQTATESETVTDGASATAETELDAGEYVFFCAIPGHREAGMEGTLTVR